MRYAPQASFEFNARLDTSLRALADDFRKTLGDAMLALVLGGGYGRGEGAVVRRDGVEQPYNDLDLILVMHRGQRVDPHRLELLRARQEARFGVEIDVGRPLTTDDIERWPCWLMWQDLLVNHVVLVGPPDVLTAHAPERVSRPLPAIEGTRLLLNRGAGLLWSLLVVRRAEPAPDSDFVRRNFYKCALALGDALLIAHKHFVTRYEGRDQRLRALFDEVPAAPPIFELYQSALRFKFCPDQLPARPPTEDELDALARDWWRVFLYVENVRTCHRYPHPVTYLRDHAPREPGLNRPSRWTRNLVHNLRDGRLSLHYPRERLYRILPPLLMARDTPTWSAEAKAFLRTWKRFN